MLSNLVPARLFRRPVVLLAALFLAGCSSGRVHYLTDYRYPKTPKSATIDLFKGEADRPCEKIAIIQTAPRSDRGEKSSEKQMEELRRIARRIGADAVQDVRRLTAKGSGFVGDPATPFPSLKQGAFESFFLRGAAVKFVDPKRDLGPQSDRKPLLEGGSEGEK